jgi:uncharacterized protein YcfJ
MGFNDRISSARAVSARARIEDSRSAPLPVAPRVTFYEKERFVGQQVTAEEQVSNFERLGGNDRASSVDVVGYRWEVCEHADFAGKCVVLRPGRYPTLTSLGLGNNISSARIVGGYAPIDDSRYAPAPAAAHDGRDYRRRGDERLYEANVTSARAVIATADQRCWVEQEQVPQEQRGLSTPGAVVGALVGGILGHQLSHGKTIATVGGAAAGGALGANVGRITGGNQPAQTRDVQKCASVPSQTPTYWDVTYDFRGQEHRIQTTGRPGPSVTVNERGEPRL